MQKNLPRKFGKSSTALEVLEGIDLTGKVAIVTGASSGIGIETARALAYAGALTILAVRDVKKGGAVASEIEKMRGPHPIQLAVEELDLSLLDSVRAFTDRFLKRFSSLNILINNAGVMAGPLARTAQGFEAQFATNHLGHFLLTCRLLPALKKGGPARVVCLSSLGHRLSSIRFEDVHFEKTPYDKWLAYGQAKSANALFALALDRRLAPQGVRAFSVYPGDIMTGLQKDLTHEEMVKLGWFEADGKTPREGFKTPGQGAATSVWAATSEDALAYGGGYLEDCGFHGPAQPENRGAGFEPHVADHDIAERLWKISEDMVGEIFS